MTDVESRRTRRARLFAIPSIAAVGFGALALWSAWNPGFYYLARTVIFTLLGAAATFAAAKPLAPRHAPTLALLFMSAVLTVALIVEGVTAPANQVESINFILAPLLLLATVAAAVTWLIRR